MSVFAVLEVGGGVKISIVLLPQDTFQGMHVLHARESKGVPSAERFKSTSLVYSRSAAQFFAL